ncbi:MAG: O-antigen ligase family protein [Candidatus Omnitrophota bacterium]|nr:tetratricopeptide repeat protein [Candidatus Omnitrophota bacterium]MBU3929359.1 tetratricopeptide repeat protein [bacterium]MBU4122782.1 tetratricopeptide repeat protein [bacterium]
MIPLLFLLVPLAVNPWGLDPYLIKNLLVCLTLCYISLKTLYGAGGTRRGHLSVQISVFLAIIFLSLAASSNLSVSALKLAGTASILLLYFFIDDSGREKALDFTAYAIIIVCAAAIGQKSAFLMFSFTTGFAGRVSSTLGNPNFLSSYLLISFPLFIYWAKKKNKQYLTALPYIAILPSETAGSILALLPVLALFFFGKKNKFSLPGILFPAHLLVIIVAIFATDISSKQMSVKERFFKWKVGVEILKKQPVLGAGWGGVKSNFALYQNKVKRDWTLKSTSESKIHNDYIQIAAESGIAGALAYAWLLISALILLRKKNFYAFAALIAFMLDSITNFPGELPSSLMLLPLILSFDGGDEKLKQGKAPGIVIALIAVTSLFIIGKDFAADISRKKGYDSYAAGDFKKAESSWLRAHRLSPTSGKSAYALGMLYVNTKNYTGAINKFLDSIRIRQYGEVYNNLGNALYLSGNIPAALKAWEKAVELECPEKENIQKNIQLLGR